MSGSDDLRGRTNKKRSFQQRSSDAREWIMFAVAIGIIIYFALRGADLSTGWLMLLGSMLGLSMLIAGVDKITGRADQESETVKEEEVEE